jgi:YbbR domain-containing protein
METDPTNIRVRIETAVTSNVSVGIKFDGQLASGYKVIDTKIDPTQVQATGTQDVINSLTQATAVVKLDGSDRDINQKVKLIAYDEFDKPIKFVIFTPEQVSVNVTIANQGGGKIVGVKPKLNGAPASGYWISSITYDPTTVRIMGSEDKMQSVDYIETQAIDITSINQNRQVDSQLVMPDGITLMSGEPQTINVKISVSLNAQSRQVVSGFSYTGLSGTVTNINPNIVNVMITGSSSVLSSLSSANVVINLDLSGKGAGTYVINITKSSISVPNGAVISSFLPNNVTVTIQ